MADFLQQQRIEKNSSAASLRDQPTAPGLGVIGKSAVQDKTGENLTAVKGSLLARVLPEFELGNYDKAIAISLGKGNSEPEVVNARAVCMMRLGQHEEPVRLYRALLVPAGGTGIRPYYPDFVKINFATALLMASQVNGCLEVLSCVGPDSQVEASPLRQWIKNWESKLSLLEWLDWKINCVESRRRPVSLEGVVGIVRPFTVVRPV